MNNQELIIELAEVIRDMAMIKAQRDQLQNEVEFLRVLLADKLKERQTQ